MTAPFTPVPHTPAGQPNPAPHMTAPFTPVPHTPAG